MRASLNFIKDFVDANMSIEELERLISLHVIEVEGISKLVEASNLTIGEVLECEMHPDSDHLHVCKVNVGNEELQIVCGAPNCTKGIKVIVALVGAVLPGDFKIKKSKVRGIESCGMLCSLQELGIPESFVPEEFKNGIFIFDENAQVGENPLAYLGLDDTIIELGLTPNRGDLLSHLGIAYDIAAASKKPVTYLAPIMKNNKESSLSVKLETSDCYAYYARKINNVKIAESPWWLKSRLMACGVRPINNVVDITNYVMLELGQPLHAFDADVIGNNIVVRNAYDNEEMNTLDEIKRVLNSGDIVITDGTKPMALGGVMGGLESSVTDKTVNIVLESAIFNPQAIRKTSTRLALRSESSMRYERKVDPNRVMLALDRASQLFNELAGALVDENYTCVDNTDKNDKIIYVNVERLNNYLGTKLSNEEVISIFEDLCFEACLENNEIKVMVPTRRVDINNYQDLTEEVARMYGFENIESTLPVTDSKGALTETQKKVRSLRHALANLGFNETVNYSLIAKKDVDKFREVESSISLLMPMTEERETLRLSLINSMVEAFKYNKARQNSNLALFEIGRIYNGNEDLVLSCGLMGLYESSLWQGKKVLADFYLLKGILDHTLDLLGYKATYKKAVNRGLHDGQTAEVYVNNTKIGVIGALHPNVLKENDLDKAYVFELNLTTLFNCKPEEFKYMSTPKYPAITRDLAILINKDVAAQDILALVKQTGKKTLVDLKVFDVYEGDKIDSSLKSIAISLTFRDNEKTLLSEDVDKLVGSILKRLEFTYQAKLRS